MVGGELMTEAEVIKKIEMNFRNAMLTLQAQFNQKMEELELLHQKQLIEFKIQIDDDFVMKKNAQINPLSQQRGIYRIIQETDILANLRGILGK